MNVKHFLKIYSTRMEMQEAGITNPCEEIKKFTRNFVEILGKIRLEEHVIIKENSFWDDKENRLIEIPFDMEKVRNWFPPKCVLRDFNSEPFYLEQSTDEERRFVAYFNHIENIKNFLLYYKEYVGKSTD
ncbi:MAG: hypothetical protein GC181_11500 [Bacteroidetes bacterium]|nr:hypothetical protein [Bacteroidota bacterium]